MLYIIRHGESIANTRGIYQGQSYDTDLTGRGKEQARAAAKALATFKIDSIITSPSRRCLQTAQIIDYSINRIIIQNKLILEINHGTWEGKSPREFTNKELRVLKKWKNEPEKTQMLNGEHFNDVVDRCRKTLKMFEEEDGDCLLVTHDTTSKIFILLAMKMPFNNFWNITLDNCGITKIALHPLRLLSLNENNHLNGLKSAVKNQVL